MVKAVYPSEFGDSLEKEQKAKILLDLLQQELE